MKKCTKIPILDLGSCSECRGCIEVAPKIFQYNEATGRMEIADVRFYPQDLVDEAIKNCPKDSIQWEFFIPSKDNTP